MLHSAPLYVAAGAKILINWEAKSRTARIAGPSCINQGTAPAGTTPRTLKFRGSPHTANLAHSPQLWQDVSLMGSRHGNTPLPCLTWAIFAVKRPKSVVLAAGWAPALLDTGVRKAAVVHLALPRAKISPALENVSRVSTGVIHNSVPKRILLGHSQNAALARPHQSSMESFMRLAVLTQLTCLAMGRTASAQACAPPLLHLSETATVKIEPTILVADLVADGQSRTSSQPPPCLLQFTHNPGISR